MTCQNLFSGKNKKNISVYHLLKILPRVLSVKTDVIKFVSPEPIASKIRQLSKFFSLTHCYILNA